MRCIGILILAFTCFLLLSGTTTFAQEGDTLTARLQIVHNAADPAAASVDVYVNGDTLLTGFGFREATPFVSVPADVDLTVEI